MSLKTVRGNSRVVHVIEYLHRGAVENWLVRMFRHAKRSGLQLDWTFYCTLGMAGDLDSEVAALGGRIIYSPVPIGRKLAFIRALRGELRRGGYDVLHCHHDLVSAIYLTASFGLPIRLRLVHVHNADESVLTPRRWKQRLLLEPLRLTCLTLSDRIVGISQHTLDTFLNGRARRLGRDVVHYYGVDATRFQAVRGDREGFRRDWNLPVDSLLLLFAGRMVPEKNPVFAVEVLAELNRLNPRVYGVFVGSGSLEIPAKERAEQLGVKEAVLFLGWSNAIPEIMSACDWYILPHPEQPMEGFGLAVVEAQLAGLRLILSTGIADDPLLPDACVARLSLTAGPTAWARSAIDLLARARPSHAQVIISLARSPFDMDIALRDLLALYQ